MSRDVRKMQVAMAGGRRVVFTTFGSLGDLRPYLALGCEMQRRGHRAVLATSEFFRAFVEPHGLEFRAIRPDVEPQNPEWRKTLMHPRKGSEFLLRRVLFPRIRESYADLLDAVQGADLLVSHVVTYAAPLVARQTGIPWVSTVLAPFQFFSEIEPPLVASELAWVHGHWPRVNAWVNRAGKWHSRRWADPVHELQRELGQRSYGNPIFEGQYSPRLTLGLFSKALAKAQSDWPGPLLVTGFPFFDAAGDALSPEAAEFFDAGEPPVVFTLGSAAVMSAGRFYEESLEACRRLNLRALLLAGDEAERIRAIAPPSQFCVEFYAPHSQVFPRANVVVHQGGIGTTAEALRAGHPMLVVPFAHDQPDNAARIARLGAGLRIPARRYNASRTANALAKLTSDPAYGESAQRLGRQVRAEQGVAAACDALEAQMEC